MKKLWKQRVERWATEFLSRLDDEAFERYITRARYVRTLRKNLVFTECSKLMSMPTPSPNGLYFPYAGGEKL